MDGISSDCLLPSVSYPRVLRLMTCFLLAVAKRDGDIEFRIISLLGSASLVDEGFHSGFMSSFKG